MGAGKRGSELLVHKPVQEEDGRRGTGSQCWSSSWSTWSSLRDVTASFQVHQDFNAMRHNRETEGGLEGLRDDSAGNRPIKAEGPEFKSPGEKKNIQKPGVDVCNPVLCREQGTEVCWTCLDPGSVRWPVSRKYTHTPHTCSYIYTCKINFK